MCCCKFKIIIASSSSANVGPFLGINLLQIFPFWSVLYHPIPPISHFALSSENYFSVFPRNLEQPQSVLKSLLPNLTNSRSSYRLTQPNSFKDDVYNGPNSKQKKRGVELANCLLGHTYADKENRQLLPMRRNSATRHFWWKRIYL